MKHLTAAILAGSLILSGAAWADSGQEIFEKKCATCHGKDGKGDTKMGRERKVLDLSDAAVQAKFTDEKAITDVTEGVPDKKFPSFKEKLSADEIKTAVAYVRTLAPKAAPAK
jgi:mono/diheme cytochrome c family protein